MRLSRLRIALLLAGLVIACGVLALPRPGSEGRKKPAAPAAEIAAVAEAEPEAPPVRTPWSATPPRKAERSRPANPLQNVARGIMAAPSGGGAAPFVQRDRDASAFFTPKGITLALSGRARPGAGPSEQRAIALRWGLVGAAEVEPRGRDEMPGKVHHYVGDRSTWKENQPTYGSILYEGVRPGVDLTVESRPSAVKYTLHADRGADAAGLRFRYAGAHSIRVAEDGASVEVDAGVGTLREDGLHCWQDGPEGRKVVSARYEARGPGEVEIVLGEMDPELPLTVDPVITWSTYIGGSVSPAAEDYGYSVAADNNGNVYVTGYTYCTDFPGVAGQYSPTLKGQVDGFLIKLSAGGIQWATYLGGTESDYAQAVAVDSSGDPVVVGYTVSSDFPATVGDTILNNYDAFVIKFRSDGAFDWSTFLGGTNTDYGQAVAVDSNDNVIVGGYTHSTNFPIENTNSTPDVTPNGFVAKLDSGGAQIVWSRYLGGDQTDYVRSVAVDTSGGVYAAGYTYSTNFAQGGLDTDLGGLVDGFLARIEVDGDFSWSTYIGGSNSDYVEAVTVTSDLSQEPVVVGDTSSDDFPVTPGALDEQFDGTEAFVARVKSGGGGLIYATFLGGTNSDYATGVAPGAAGSVYVTGYTYSGNFPTTAGAYRQNSIGLPDGFVTQINALGTWPPVASTYIGGSASDFPRSIAVVASGGGAGVYLAGNTYSSNYPASPAPPLDPSLGGTTDAFASRLPLLLTSLTWSSYVGGQSSMSDDIGQDVAVDPAGNAYVTGYTSSSDFPTQGAGVDTGLGGNQDVFVMKIATNAGIPSIVWSTFLGGTGSESAYAICVDRLNFPYVTGHTSSSNFPLGGSAPGNTWDNVFSGSTEAFATCLNPGGTLWFSTFLGGSNSDYGRAITVDPNFNSYITGYTYSSNFPTGNSFDNTLAASPDAFILKLNVNGQGVWGTYLGGDNDDYGTAISVDDAGTVFVAGYTYSTNFTTSGIDNSLGGTVDAFLAKVTTAGALSWSRYLGGSGSDYGLGVTVDPTGAFVYMTGYTHSDDFPAPGGLDGTLGTPPDAFVTRINPTTGALTWSTFLGGSSSDYGFDVDTDASGNVLVTGYTYSADFPTKGAVDPTHNGSADVFVTKLYAAGGLTSLAWSTFLGGSSYDFGYGIACFTTAGPPPAQTVYVMGTTQSGGMSLINPLDNSFNAITDVFLVRLDKANPDDPDFVPVGTGIFRQGGVTPIPFAGWTNETEIVVKAKLTDSDDEQVRLQVEIKPVGTDFTGTPLVESAAVPSGGIASVIVPLAGAPPVEYHLRARTIDADNKVSGWVNAYDALNDDSPLPAGRDVGRDTAAPTVTITTPATPTYYTQSSTIALAGTSGDVSSGVASIGWSRIPLLPLPNSGGVTPPLDAWTISSVSLAAGSNTITVQATDAAGNPGQAVVTVIRDNTAPNVSITPPAQTTIGTNSLALSGFASDTPPGQLQTVEWVNNRGGSGFASLGPGTAWNATISPLSPGANIITVIAKDFAGNPASTQITLTYDDANPSVAIFAPVTGTITNDATIAMNGNASDNLSLSSVALRNDTTGVNYGATLGVGGNWTSDTDLVLQEGNNVLQATATDGVGRTTTVSVLVFLDTASPAITITFPTEQPPAIFTTGSQYVSLSGTATDNRGVASVTWSRDPVGLPPDASPPAGTLATPGSTSTTFSTPLIELHSSPQVNTITVTLTDLAGNTHTDTVLVVRDNSGPSITLTNPTSNPHVQPGNGITLTGTVSDNGGVQTLTCVNTTTGNSFPVVPASPLPTGAGAVVTWSSTVLLQSGINLLQISAGDGGATTVFSLTVICDPSPPVVKVTGPTTADDYHTGVASIVLTGTATDNREVNSPLVATLGATPVPVTGVGTWSTNILPLNPGSQTFTITATDAAGNSHQDTLNIIYDPDLPTVLITQPTVADTYLTTSPTLTGLTALGGDAADAGPGMLKTVTWSNAANGTGGTATGTSGWTVSSITLDPGANFITVVAIDLAGNLRTDTLLVYYDTEDPEVVITGPSPNPTYVTNLATIALEGTASDDIGVETVEWRNANAAPPTWVTASGTTAWSDLAVSLVPGDNAITVRATDRAGRVGTQLITIHYDPTAPTLAVTLPDVGDSTTGTPYDASGTASDVTGSGIGVDVTQVIWKNLTTGGIGNAVLSPGAWSAAVPLTSGANSLEFTAYDAAGNSTTVTRILTYDPAAPFVSIISPTTDLTFTTGATPAVLGGTATDDVGVVSVEWSTTAAVEPNFGPVDSFTSPDWIASVPLVPGPNVITITATDAVGRTGTSRITIVYDPTPPVVAITQPTAETTYITTITPLPIGGAASDNIEVIEVVWVNETTGENGIALGTGAWTVTGISLVEGPNLITVTATDGVGNVGTTSLTVIYDGTSPTISISTIDAQPATDPFPTSTRPLAFAGLAGDNLGLASLTWTNSLGGGGSAVPTPVLPATAVTWTASIYLFPGNNVITFTATDGHGYTATAIVNVPFTPESTAPTIVINTPSSTGTATSPTQIVTVGGTADDNVGVIEVRWLNQATGVRGAALLSGGPNPVDWAADIPLTNGLNVIVATAEDDAGNTTSASIAITYASPPDAVPPAITITGPTLLDVWDASSSPLLLTMAVLDNVGVASVTFFNAATGGDGVGTPVVADTWTASVALALGANPITVTVRDPAGNTATDALVVNFIPGPGDSSNPVVTITSHPTGTTLDWASSVIDLAGIASDNVQIATVIWSNAANARSGSADGTDAWTTTLLLVPGINVITMRTYDTSGNTDTDQITILYTPPPLPPEHIPGGHCGLLGLEVLALIALRRRRRK